MITTKTPDTGRVRWLRDQGDRASGGVRLFCFPHAGAGASAFRGWPELLGPATRVTAVQFPGREDRFREAVHDRLECLLDDLVPALADSLDGPYALFGHSMGALVAYEAARRLVERGAPPPLHLFVSAHAAPHARHRRRYVSSLPQGKKDITTLSLLPTLRADFKLYETYEYVDGPPLPCRVTVLAGADDDVPPLDLALWRELNTGPFRMRVIDGDDQFVTRNRQQVAEVVRAGLAGEF